MTELAGSLAPGRVEAVAHAIEMAVASGEMSAREGAVIANSLFRQASPDERAHISERFAILRSTPRVAPKDTRHGLITVPIADFLGDEEDADQPEDFLIASILPPGVVAIMAGEPKVRKTWLALLIAISVASGRKLFGRFEVRQGSAVVVAEEDTQAEIRKRLWWLARGLDIDPRGLPVRVAVASGFRIDDDAKLAALERDGKGSGIYILDALTRIHGLDENSRTEMQTVTLALQRLATNTGATVLAVHHLRKKNQGDEGVRLGQRMRGTGDLHALARAVIGVTPTRDGEAVDLHPESNYGQGLAPFTVRLEMGARESDGKNQARFVYVGGARDAEAEGDDSTVLALLREQARPLSKSDVRALFRGRAIDADAAIKRLADRQAITLVDSEKVDMSGRTRSFKGWTLTERATRE